jgi:hypothetical protein
MSFQNLLQLSNLLKQKGKITVNASFFSDTIRFGTQNLGNLRTRGNISKSIMDPSGRDIKRILRRHEDILEGVRDQFKEHVVHFTHLNHSIQNLFHRIEIVERDSLRIIDLEHSIPILSQRVDLLEHELIHYRAREKELERPVASLLGHVELMEHECVQF